MNANLVSMLVIGALLLVPPNGAYGTEVGTAFTYQGQLKDDGQPVNDTCDFEFSLWGAPSDGVQIGSTASANAVVATNGLFTVAVDFNTNGFTGDARWLQIAVRCSGDPAFTTLSPRQELTPAPYALALPGLWTEQNATSPNLIGGYNGNSVEPAVRATT